MCSMLGALTPLITLKSGTIYPPIQRNIPKAFGKIYFEPMHIIRNCYF